MVLIAQNDRWGLWSMETRNSGANHIVLHAQNDRWGLGTIETINSDANHIVVHAQNDTGSLAPIETFILIQNPAKSFAYKNNT